MSSLSVRLAIVMAQSSSLAASTFVIYNNFKPTQTLKWFFTKFLPKKLEQLFNLFIKLIFDALKDIKKALLKILKDLWAIIQYAFNKIKEFVMGVVNKIADGAKKIIKDIEVKVWYYQLFTKVKYAGSGDRYETLKEIIQNKVTQHPEITLNDFEFEIFRKIGELYDEMNDKPDMIGCGAHDGDY